MYTPNVGPLSRSDIVTEPYQQPAAIVDKYASTPSPEDAQKEVESKLDKPLKILKNLALGTGVVIGGLGGAVTAPVWLLTTKLGELIGSKITRYRVDFPLFSKDIKYEQLDRSEEGAKLGMRIGSFGFSVIFESCCSSLFPKGEQLNKSDFY